MDKKARIITNGRFDNKCYDIEIWDNNTKRWELCAGYPLHDNNSSISVGIVTRIMSLIMQGYTIYDER